MPKDLECPISPEQELAYCGRVIRSARHLLGLTMEQLSRKAHVSRGPLNALELGHSWPQVPHLVSICRAAQVSLDTMFGLDVDLAPEELLAEKELLLECRKRPGMAAAVLAMLRLEQPLRVRAQQPEASL
jgi:transcriptional regulator with XRE-family HTH domain